MAKHRSGNRHNTTGRSTGEGKHVRHYEWETASPAYRSLSCHARCLLTELKRVYNGENNGALFLSVRTAAGLLNVSKDTATKAFRELQDRGFIRARQIGHFGWKQGQATTWILEEFSCDGQLPTKTFMRWRPAQKLEAGPAYKDTLSGQEGHLSAEGHQKQPNCPAHKDTFDENASKSVLPSRTHIVTKGGSLN